MSSFALLLGALALGYLFANRRWMPADSPAVLNAWVIRIALPALVLVQIPKIPFQPELLFAAAGPWMVALGACVVVPLTGRLLRWDRGRTGAVLLTCGLGNTAFMGLPMIQALFGRDAIGTAVISDQLGSFMMLSTLGVLIAALYSGQQIHARAIARRVVLFPPFIALIAAFVVGALGGWPAWIEYVLDRLAETLTPVALFTVGFQMRFGDVWRLRLPIAAGLTWKLLLAPALVLGVGMALGITGQLRDVTVTQSAMAPMITAGIMAADARLEPPLATAMLAAGIALSFLTVPLWTLML
ncbi:AEC family transporter [uncultured Abyssibacter sp.]|uniref:AEC family transporter n=1 Tax=uncultured Abyssibacter sp. TaxID=2320202 RepID=UPI0032B0F189